MSDVRAATGPAWRDAAVRISERGREGLLAGLRPVFARVARAHGEGLTLTDEDLEQMVERAAERADGRQWHRALLRAATTELGIDLGEALSHPAVARAEELVSGAAKENRGGDSLSLPAIHLRGLAGLDPEAPGLTLQFSAAGLDIVRADDEVLGRLPWTDITALEIPSVRQRRRRRRGPAQAELIIRSAHGGDAGFQVPDVTPEQLHDRLEPVVERHSGG